MGSMSAIIPYMEIMEMGLQKLSNEFSNATRATPVHLLGRIWGVPFLLSPEKHS